MRSEINSDNEKSQAAVASKDLCFSQVLSPLTIGLPASIVGTMFPRPSRNYPSYIKTATPTTSHDGVRRALRLLCQPLRRQSHQTGNACLDRSA